MSGITSPFPFSIPASDRVENVRARVRRFLREVRGYAPARRVFALAGLVKLLEATGAARLSPLSLLLARSALRRAKQEAGGREHCDVPGEAPAKGGGP